MTKYLAREGDRVTVLTTSAHGHDAAAGGAAEVVRTWDLRRLRPPPKAGDARGAGGAESGSPRTHPLRDAWVPDRMAVSWAPFAVRAALALHRRHRFDVVVTTSPPESAHLVGWALASRGCAWVADLRDGWTFEAWRQFPTRLQRRLDERLERRMIESADVVTCVTPPVADDLRGRMDADPVLVPHGFDPDQLAAAREEEGGAAEMMLDPGRVSIVYTGRLGAVGRDLTGLRRALRELAAQEHGIAERLELAIAGPVRREERELFEMDLSPLRVSSLGPVAHQRALALQQAADALLVLGSLRSHVANLKLYEYIGSRTPILAIAEGTETGRIVAEAGGEVVPAADAQAIKGALRRAAMRDLAATDEAVANAFAYPAPAERMKEAVELAIERSAARRRKRRRARGDERPAAGGERAPGLRRAQIRGEPGDFAVDAPRGGRVQHQRALADPRAGVARGAMGSYWLYFAHHHGDHIRLAYADDLDGPWRIHGQGALRLDQVAAATGHIASPDVHVDDERRRIRMYFHAPARGGGGQKSFAAVSEDGLAFEALPEPIGSPYFRAFRWRGNWFAVARGGELYRSKDGLSDFEQGPSPFARSPGFDSIRHVATHLVGDSLWVYFTRVGDAPERILRVRIDLSEDWTAWGPVTPPQEVLRPEQPYEGSDRRMRASRLGAAAGPENAVRDPAIFAEGGRTYLVYSVAGETGLAVAELTEEP